MRLYIQDTGQWSISKNDKFQRVSISYKFNTYHKWYTTRKDRTMREIKFRGMAVDGTWVYGSLVQGGGGHTLKVMWILQEDATFDEATRVYPSTVGEFTGLKDKNDVEIYEGDCVHHHHGRRGWLSPPVEWKKIDGEQFDSVGFEIDPACLNDAEVVGNIHDNPELMEEEG